MRGAFRAGMRELVMRLLHFGASAALIGGLLLPIPGSALDLATAEDGTWHQLPPPSARYLHAAVHDPARDRMIVFGGYSKRGLLNDVWILSLAGTPEWSRVEPTGTPPSSRHAMSAIHDPVRDRIVMYGGADGVVGLRDDVWILSLDSDPTWTRITPAGSGPGARAFHSAIYDPLGDRMIVFGGAGNSGANAGPANDAWALSLSGPPAWTLLSPAGHAPSPRYEQSAVYDAARDRILVFGGFDGKSRLNDVWSLSLRGRPRWRPLDPAGPLPTPRSLHTAIFDPEGDRMVVFSGLTNGTVGDTWSLSLRGRTAWSRTDARAEPRIRWGHTATFDPVRARMVVFGGTPDGYDLDGELWGLSLSASPIWTDLETPDKPPPPRRGLTAVHDPVRGRALVFGGYDQLFGFYNDVWILSLVGRPVWTMLRPSGVPPSPREGHAAIYDPLRDRVLVFGGQTDAFTMSNEVWALSLSGEPAWERIVTTGAAPDARTHHTAIYDPTHDRMIIHGGVGSWYKTDVWALSLSGQPRWTLLDPTGTPGARFEHSAIYDPIRERMVVFGGLDPRLGSGNDVWALSLGETPAWSPITPTGIEPAGRAAHEAIHDPARDRMVVFGGFSYSPGASPGSEAWAFSLDHSEWTLLQPAGMAPSATRFHSAVFDPVADRMLVIGGNASNDVWELAWGSPPLGPEAVAHAQRPVPERDPAALELSPNPSHGPVAISFRLAHAGEASVRIYDVAGRTIRTIASAILPAGRRTITWDRRDSAGALARPGLYFCEVRTKTSRSAGRIMLVR
jgi:hypothetical protein